MNQVFKDFESAVQRLDEVLSVEHTDIQRDSAIKRFEICFDLGWKAVKNVAREQGKECYSPRSCFGVAFQIGLMEHEKKWVAMIEDRNKTAHTYNQVVAEEVYDKLQEYCLLLKELLKKLNSEKSL